jgi:hypothetical protein
MGLCETKILTPPLNEKSKVMILRSIILNPTSDLGKKFRSFSKKQKMEELILFMDDIKSTTSAEYIFENYILDSSPQQINIASDEYHQCINLFNLGERNKDVLFCKIYEVCMKEFIHSETFMKFQKKKNVIKYINSYKDAILVYQFFSTTKVKKMEKIFFDKSVQFMIMYCEDMYDYLNRDLSSNDMFSRYLQTTSVTRLPAYMLLSDEIINSFLLDELINERFVLCVLRLSQYCEIMELVEMHLNV